MSMEGEITIVGGETLAMPFENDTETNSTGILSSTCSSVGGELQRFPEGLEKLKALGVTAEDDAIICELPRPTHSPGSEFPIDDASLSPMSQSFAPGTRPRAHTRVHRVPTGTTATTGTITDEASAITPIDDPTTLSQLSRVGGSKTQSAPFAAIVTVMTPDEYPLDFVAPEKRFFSPSASTATTQSSTDVATVTSLRSNFTLTMADDDASVSELPHPVHGCEKTQPRFSTTMNVLGHDDDAAVSSTPPLSRRQRIGVEDDGDIC